MKKNLTRTVSGIACLTIILCAAASCGAEQPAQGSSAPADTQISAGTAETEPSEFDPGLPKSDFGGAAFNFVGRGIEGMGEAWDNTDIVVKETNGEVLNDAFWARTDYIENKYNVKIGMLFGGYAGEEMQTFVTSSVMAGDNDFDVILANPYDTTTLTLNHMLTDLSALPYLDLSKPWWDQNATKELSFGGKVYFTTGEVTIVDNLATFILLFNKDVVTNYDIDNPYDEVRGGTWTVDKMISNVKAVANDVNGNKRLDDEDLFGYIDWQDAAFGFLHASGNTVGAFDKDGIPYYSFATEHMFNTWDKLHELLAGGGSFSAFQGINKLSDPDSIMDHALYKFGNVKDVIALRNRETPFGVLPLPKYDEAQDRYYCTAHGYGTCLVSVPITIEDEERTGILLEAFCAKSAELVTPAFYNDTLTVKSVRDEESVEMLELIYASKKYDIGYFYEWGGLPVQMLTMWNSKSTDCASKLEKKASAVQADVEKMLDFFNE